MAPRAPRQTRLETGDEDDLARRWANYRVLRKTFLSATALASFSYCRVKPFVERVLSALGLDTDTWQMRAGAAAHEALQGAITEHVTPSRLTFAEAFRQNAFLIEMERPLSDARRRLRGIADIVYASAGTPYVIELKNSRPPPNVDPTWNAAVRFEHGLQLQFYGWLARTEFGRRPLLALSHLRDLPRAELLDRLDESGDAERALGELFDASAKLTSSAESEDTVRRLVARFRAAERRSTIPTRDHEDAAKCRTCRVRSWCPRRLDDPTRVELIDARRLAAES